MKYLQSPDFKNEPITGGTLVIFGEVFPNSYCTGLIKAAEKQGFQVIYSTLGRRQGSVLRDLNKEELANSPLNLINVPLEAGFDLTLGSDKKTPVDLINEQRQKNWNEIVFKTKNSYYKKAEEDFKRRCTQWAIQLQARLSEQKGPVLFAHIMAGGFPRTPVALKSTARLFKGHGERFQSSKAFFDSELGHVFLKNFEAVAADTFKTLVKSTTELRTQLNEEGRKTAYVAYGYHGNFIWTGKTFEWRGVAPYSHGHAKVKLEQISQDLSIPEVTVFNCPEVLTRSSKIFSTLDSCIFSFLLALDKNYDSLPSNIQESFHSMKSELTIEWELFSKKIYEFFNNSTLDFLKNPSLWPQDNKQKQVDLEYKFSKELRSFFKDYDKVKIQLSHLIIETSGKIMLRTAFSTPDPVCWIGHNSIISFLNSD